jgi:hypothetical protein
VRVELSPTLDTGGHVGFEGALSLGLGLPLDYRGRSHHFFQARPGIGGGVEPASHAPMVLAHADVDYVYWAEPRMDVRAGMRLSYRGTRDAKLWGFGGRLGLLPMVWANDGNWLVSHLCVGPELRLEHVSADPGGGRGIFSVPLVVEGNFLAAGD